MKKVFILFVCIFVLGLAGICVLPGYILKEAENVTLTEQVVLGDREVVEGVTVNTANAPPAGAGGLLSHTGSRSSL